MGYKIHIFYHFLRVIVVRGVATSVAILFMGSLAGLADAAYSQSAKLLPDDLAENDNFGISVAISGDYAIVGAANQDDADNIRVGAAYIYKWSEADGWTQLQKIASSDGGDADNERFGRSVDIDGDYAIIGAYSMAGGGAAYIFKRDGDVWSEQEKLLSDDLTNGDEFGYSVGISGDYAIVGAQRDDDNFGSSGSAYIFVRSGESWTQQAKLNASDPVVGLFFGKSVGISGDYAIVGAMDPADYRSEAYLFERSGENWTQVQKIESDDIADGDHFGFSVAIDGDYAIVGAYEKDEGAKTAAGAAYIFERDGGGTWSQQQKLQGDVETNDYFGYSVDIAGDYAIVGARSFLAKGYAYVFERDGESWVRQEKLSASDEQNGDYFGYDVAIMSTGAYALVGADEDDNAQGDEAGAAYLFNDPDINAEPLADAGADAADQPDGVEYLLSGSCTDDDADDTLTGWWLQTAGTDCGLSGHIVGSEASGSSAVTVEASCAPDVSANETLVFRLACNDGTDQATDDRNVGINAKPTAAPQSVTTDEDAAVAITLSGSDPDDEGLDYAVASDPSHGALSGVAPDLTYTPDPDYFGDDSFTFTVDDGVQASAPAIVSITVDSTYVAPSIDDEAGVQMTCAEGSACVLPDWTVTGDEDEELTERWETVSGPGTLTIDGEGAVDLTSVPPKRGTYYVQLVVDDGVSETRSELVEVIIPNHEPLIESDDDVDVEGAEFVDGVFVLPAFVSQIDIEAIFLDDDEDALAYSWSLDVADGDRAGFLSTTSGSCVLRLRMAGDLTLTVSVDDGAGGTATEEIALSVPLPEVATEDLAVSIESWHYEEDGTITVTGTLRSPVWPVVIVNVTVVAEVTLLDEASGGESETVDGVTYETYSFTAEGVTELDGEIPISVEILTTVDGDGVPIVADPVELTSGFEDAADSGGGSGSGCGCALGAVPDAGNVLMPIAVFSLVLLFVAGVRRQRVRCRRGERRRG